MVEEPKPAGSDGSGTEDRSAQERILRAARRLAQERGYKGTTLAMIQREAGVHPGSLYWHFKDKDELFAVLVRDAAHGSDRLRMDVAGSTTGNPIKAALDAIVADSSRYGLWRFNVQLMLDPDMRASRTADEIRRLRRRTQQVLVRAWEEQMPPRVQEHDPGLSGRLSDYALAVIEGLVLSRVAGTVRDEEFITSVASATINRVVVNACDEVGEDVPVFFREGLAGTA